MNKIVFILPVLGLAACSPNQQTQNPYDPAAANPYAVPGAQNTYDPNATAAAPYQPVNPPAYGQQQTYTPAPETAYTPSAPATPAPAAGGGSHTVVAGDSLWGISRKYGTTVEAIQAANGLEGTLIRTGQTLTIPR
ncbi:MAG: LysM peptidoglycan-binding domain-containing protein [Verrucomicrobiales bacterium]